MRPRPTTPYSLFTSVIFASDYAAVLAATSKSGFSETSHRVYPRQAYPFVANLSIDADDSINFHEFVNQPIGHSKLFIKLCIPPLKHGHLKAVGLKRLLPSGVGCAPLPSRAA